MLMSRDLWAYTAYYIVLNITTLRQEGDGTISKHVHTRTSWVYHRLWGCVVCHSRKRSTRLGLRLARRLCSCWHHPTSTAIRGGCRRRCGFSFDGGIVTRFRWDRKVRANQSTLRHGIERFVIPSWTRTDDQVVPGLLLSTTGAHCIHWMNARICNTLSWTATYTIPQT